ncbi:uncharacterized protein [Anser cygnoides]|uniref:uncharacterized protein isoform X1 n=1 Tax=Anser cygnoides TaxID=8845 RepID=UPI0034D38D2C
MKPPSSSLWVDLLSLSPPPPNHISQHPPAGRSLPAPPVSTPFRRPDAISPRHEASPPAPPGPGPLRRGPGGEAPGRGLVAAGEAIAAGGAAGPGRPRPPGAPGPAAAGEPPPAERGRDPRPGVAAAGPGGARGRGHPAPRLPGGAAAPPRPAPGPHRAAVPAPTLWVLQGQKEYFFGDAVTLVCTTPPSITGKLTYQIFGEAGWAVSGFSSTNNYTFEFVLSRMQHRGPHFCSYSLKQGRKQLISPTSEKLVIKIGDHLPQPLLTVESPLGEVMAGDLLSIICKAPGDATVRRFHFYRDGQEVLPMTEGSEDNAADHGGNLRTSMVLQLPRAGPQQSGNFTCKYEEKKPERWIPSFTSQAVSISINAQKKGKSCFLLLRLLVVGGCFLTINSLILLFFWARGRTKDASFLSGASPAGISQLHARSPHTLQEENKYEEH